jgi:hypothetical protein
MILSYADIERCAERVLCDFLCGIPETPGVINIQALAADYLGLSIAYHTLSCTGELLGLTTYVDAEIELRGEYGRTATLYVPKDTLLLDDTLFPAPHERHGVYGCRRFTLAHECAHQILHRADPEAGKLSARRYDVRTRARRERRTAEDWREWQADALASSLIMPRVQVSALVAKYAKGRKLVSYEGRYNRPDAFALKHMHSTLGVSRAAMAVRLRQLGHLVTKSIFEYSDPADVLCDD